MIKALSTIFEIASFVVPFFVALVLLARSGDSYRESYEISKLRFLGFTRSQYIAFFRVLGILFLLLGAFAVYRNYFYEPNPELQESADFWKDINNRENLPIKSAMLLGAAIAIPARMGSSRFPGKPLALLGGKAVIERVYESCMKCERAEKVVILTDSVEIVEFADKIGAKSVMTSPKCASGTERIVEAFEEINADFVVNVQGDEPFISPALVDSIIEAHANTNVDLVTAASKISDAQTLINPNVVKVLRGNDGSAVYFSRAPLT